MKILTVIALFFLFSFEAQAQKRSPANATTDTVEVDRHPILGLGAGFFKDYLYLQDLKGHLLSAELEYPLDIQRRWNVDILYLRWLSDKYSGDIISVGLRINMLEKTSPYNLSFNIGTSSYVLILTPEVGMALSYSLTDALSIQWSGRWFMTLLPGLTSPYRDIHPGLTFLQARIKL